MNKVIALGWVVLGTWGSGSTVRKRAKEEEYSSCNDRRILLVDLNG